MKIALVVVLVVCVMGPVLYGQDSVATGSPAMSEQQRRVILQQRTPREFLFTPSVVGMRDGVMYRGYFLGYLADSVWSQSGGRQQGVPLRDVSRIALHVDPSPDRYVVPALFTGAYLGAMLMKISEKMPFGYVDHTQTGPPYGVAMALGGFMASFLSYYIGGALEREEATCTFDDRAADESTREEALVRFLMRSPAAPRFHITVTGGSVSFPWDAPTLINAYATPHGASGPRTNFLRRFQMTYSVLPFLEVGGAFLSCTRPAYEVGRSGYQGNTYSDLRYGVKQRGSAYLGVAGVSPARSILPEELAWKIFCGAGSTSWKEELSFWKWTYRWTNGTYESSVEQTVEEITRTGVAYMVGTTLEVYPYRHFSLGFSAEYLGAMGDAIPARLDLGLGEDDGSSSCIGFTLGFHF